MAGCGAGEPDAPSALPDVAEAEFLSTYARAFCEPLQGCCRAASATHDERACIAAMMRDAESLIRVRGMYTLYDGRQARVCVERVRTVVTTCLMLPASLPDWAGACKTVRVGTRVPGEICTHESDCAPSEQGTVRCIGAQLSSTETSCVVDRPGRENELCGVPSDVNTPRAEYHAACVDDLFCDNNRCVPAVANGAVCRNHRECLKASWCRPPEATAPPPSISRCEPEQPLGADCGFIDDECASGTCYEQKCATGRPWAALYCGAASKRPTPPAR